MGQETKLLNVGMKNLVEICHHTLCGGQGLGRPVVMVSWQPCMVGQSLWSLVMCIMWCVCLNFELWITHSMAVYIS